MFASGIIKHVIIEGSGTFHFAYPSTLIYSKTLTPQPIFYFPNFIVLILKLYYYYTTYDVMLAGLM